MMKRMLGTAVTLGCFLIIVACAARTPSSTVESFYRAVEKGDSEAAVEFLHPNFVKMMGEEKLRAGISEYALNLKEKGGIKDLEVKEDSVAGEAARVTAVLKYGDGTQETEKHALVKENGRWYIKPEK